MPSLLPEASALAKANPINQHKKMKEKTKTILGKGLLLIVGVGLGVAAHKYRDYCSASEVCSQPQQAMAMDSPMSPTLGGKLYTSAWIQRSAEYKALCMQAYSLATLRLDEALRAHKPGDRPLAIVTDIDETILDNTPNSVHQALKGEDYTDASWNEWCALAQADTLAGARDFFVRAAEAGVEVFYISNRHEVNRAGTLANLSRYGFPQADDAHLLLRSPETSDKTARRDQVLERYDIVMLLGDNLGDFDHTFDSSSEAVRAEGLVRYASDFGRRFIVLPNPNYGTWDKAMNGGYPPLSVRDSLLRTQLRTHP